MPPKNYCGERAKGMGDVKRVIGCVCGGRGRLYSRAGPACRPLPLSDRPNPPQSWCLSSISLISSAPPFPPPRPTTILPTLVSRRKARTAGITMALEEQSDQRGSWVLPPTSLADALLRLPALRSSPLATGPYRRSRLTLRDQVSRPLLCRYSGQVCEARYCRSSEWQAVSAAAFTYSSATSLPSTHLCAGVHRIVIEQSLSTGRSPNAIIAFAKV